MESDSSDTRNEWLYNKILWFLFFASFFLVRFFLSFFLFYWPKEMWSRSILPSRSSTMTLSVRCWVVAHEFFGSQLAQPALFDLWLRTDKLTAPKTGCQNQIKIHFAIQREPNLVRDFSLYCVVNAGQQIIPSPSNRRLYRRKRKRRKSYNEYYYYHYHYYRVDIYDISCISMQLKTQRHPVSFGLCLCVLASA